MITEQLTYTPAHGLPSGILVNSRTGQLTEIVASYYMLKMSLASSASRTYKATEQHVHYNKKIHIMERLVIFKQRVIATASEN